MRLILKNLRDLVCAFRLTTVAAVCCLTFWGILAEGQQSTKTCTGFDVRSIDISRVSDEKNLFDSMPARIEIGSQERDNADKVVTVYALGPILGSMDSFGIKTDLACSTNGFVLTATISRSGNYIGTTAKNVLWRPKINVAIILRKPGQDIEVKVRWRMRLANGREIYRAQTPPYPEQKFPIIVTTTFH